MLKRILIIIENIIIIVAAFFGAKIAYGKLLIVHANSCCSSGGECPIYACEASSPDFAKFTLLAVAIVICVTIIIFVFINTIKKIFGKI